MADATHLVARFLHVSAATLWVGYLALLAVVLVPAARDADEAAAPSPERLRPFTVLGPLTLAFGLWLVTASGHGFGDLLEPGWGHAVSGGIAIAVAMMGLEHAVGLPALREARERGPAERGEALRRAGRAAGAAAGLGLLAAFLMVLALLGGF